MNAIKNINKIYQNLKNMPKTQFWYIYNTNSRSEILYDFALLLKYKNLLPTEKNCLEISKQFFKLPPFVRYNFLIECEEDIYCLPYICLDCGADISIRTIKTTKIFDFECDHHHIQEDFAGHYNVLY